MYNLDIETLISVLQNRQIRGYFEADLAPGFAGLPEKCSVVIVLEDGKITSMTINDVHGRPLYRGNDALSKIRRTVLMWRLIESTTTPPQLSSSTTDPFMSGLSSPYQTNPSIPIQRSPSTQPLASMTGPSFLNIGALIPVRQQTSPADLRSWSRIARSVYALVNGINSVQRIADLLSLSLDAVYAELQNLQARQLIALR